MPGDLEMSVETEWWDSNLELEIEDGEERDQGGTQAE